MNGPGDVRPTPTPTGGDGGDGGDGRDGRDGRDAASAADTYRTRARTTRTARLEAFSDGVFAIAITLLVLDLAITDDHAAARNLLGAFDHQWPSYLAYLVSFTTVGALWLGHNAITDYLDHADSTLLRLNLAVLLVVSFLPFPTRLLAEFIRAGEAERVASTIYGVTLLVAATLLWALWRYALRAGLITEDADDRELSLLDQRLSPGLGGYLALIVLGLFFPVAAVVGYLLVGLFLVLPLTRIRSRTRHRRGPVDRRLGRRRTPPPDGTHP